MVEYWYIAAGDPDTAKHELHILRGGRELEYAGGITFGATDDVRKCSMPIRQSASSPSIAPAAA
jgi:hypothetical protein